MNIYVNVNVFVYVYVCVYVYVYVYAYVGIYIYICLFIHLFAASTGVLPGEADVKCAGPAFFACWYIGEHGNLADETCFQYTKP